MVVAKREDNNGALARRATRAGTATLRSAGPLLRPRRLGPTCNIIGSRDEAIVRIPDPNMLTRLLAAVSLHIRDRFTTIMSVQLFLLVGQSP